MLQIFATLCFYEYDVHKNVIIIKTLYHKHKNNNQFIKQKTINMKKYTILFVVFALAFSAKSQVIDTTIQSIVAYKIQPIKANITDTIVTNRVGIRGLVDDFKEALTIYVQFMNSSKQTLNGVIYDRIISINGLNETLTGSDYDNYDGSPEYVIKYLSKKYGFSF